MTNHETHADDDTDSTASDDHLPTRRPGDAGGRSRRGFLQSAGALGLAGVLGTGADAVGSARGATTGAAGDLWTVVAIPDTQNMDDADTVAYADSITDWVVENADRQNVAFVTHEGDMVSNGDDERELRNIDDVMSDLDGVVPWSPCVGNHDFADIGDRSSGADLFTEYFGASRFRDRGYFGGVSDNGRNFFQFFSAGGYEFLHLSLEWEAPGSPDDPGTPVGWAQGVLDDHPEHPTILTTHSYLGDDPRQRKRDVEEADGWGNSGQALWEKLVAPNPQIFMVLNGHNHDLSGDDQGEHHQVSTNVAGEDVYEMLADYQDYPNGGDGWFRRIRFIPGGGTDAPDRIDVSTYTAYYDEYQTSDRSEFGFDLDFERRFAVSGADVETVRFQQGEGYAGTVDTQLHEANAATAYGDAATVTVDAADDGGEVHGLLRFDDLVGDSTAQVPPGATVSRATLSVESTNPGDGATIHRMLDGWRETDTWNDWGGIAADGTEAAASPDATVDGPDTGTVTVDVTESVQAWVDGEPNDGWALLPSGTNGWDVETAEGSTPPTLSVTYEGGDDCDATEQVRFRSASERASTDDRFTVDRPADVQPGDVLLLAVGGTANGEDGMPYDQPDGWTRIDVCSQDDNGAEECLRDGQDLFLQFFYRVATDDEPSEYTVRAGGNSVASVTAYSGVDTDYPVASVTGLVDDGDYRVSVCPSTAGVADGMLVCGVTHDDQHRIEDLDGLTLRTEGLNGDSSTQVLTDSLGSDGPTERREVGHVDPTGNKDISMAVVLRPAPADCEEEDSGPTARIGTVPEDYENWLRLDASDSTAPDGGDLAYEWAISAGEFYRADSDTAEQPWVYVGGLDDLTATLTVTDGDGRTDTAERTLAVTGASGPGTDRLVYGGANELAAGEYLESTTGNYRLYLQSDGNLVLRDWDTKAALWASDTAGDGGTELTMQGDGNLVVYTDAGEPVWASDTAGSGADTVVLEDDGRLALVGDGTTVWSRNG